MEQRILLGDEEMAKKLRVVAYARVSTKKDAQSTSLETQKLYYQQFIESHEDWEFCGLYSDASTGTKLSRKGFSEMLLKCGVEVIKIDDKEIAKRIEGVPSQIDLIVIKSPSRFARHDMAADLISTLKSKGVEVYFESLGKSTADVDMKVLLGIFFVIDRNYSESLSRNIRIAHVRAIEQRGTIFASKVLFGYKKVGKGDKAKLVPESQAHIDIINNIFKWYIEGKGFRTIAKLVDEQGFKSKKLRSDGTYAPVGKHGIERILMNERYMGYIQIPIRTGNEPIGKIERKEGNYRIEKSDKIEPIVTEELFYKAQEVLKSKRQPLHGKKPVSAKYSRYLICADCHCHFIKAEGHAGKTLYVCSHKRSEGVSVCQMPYITESYMDEQVELEAKNIILDDIEGYRKGVINKIETFKIGFIYDYLHSDNSEQMESLKKEIAVLDKRIDNLLDMESGLDKEFVSGQLNRYFKEKKEKEELFDKYENAHTYLLDRIKTCNAYLERARNYFIPSTLTADELLSQTQYITAYKLPNATNRVQSKTNNVALEFTTKYQHELEWIAGQFEAGLESWPTLPLYEIDYMDEATKKSLLGASPI